MALNEIHVPLGFCHFNRKEIESIQLKRHGKSDGLLLMKIFDIIQECVFIVNFVYLFRNRNNVKTKHRKLTY